VKLTFTTQQHIERAQDNEVFAGSIKLSGPNDFAWRVTVTFYAAVHYVQAYLSSYGKYPIVHSARDSAVQRDRHLKKIYQDYRDLKDKSRDARYECSVMDQRDADDMDECLASVKAIIKDNMGSK